VLLSTIDNEELPRCVQRKTIILNHTKLPPGEVTQQDDKGETDIVAVDMNKGGRVEVNLDAAPTEIRAPKVFLHNAIDLSNESFASLGVLAKTCLHAIVCSAHTCAIPPGEHTAYVLRETALFKKAKELPRIQSADANLVHFL
jgi:hypothetical protein